MFTIGVISDTHGFLDSRLFDFFKECDEIWHAGDIGGFDIIEQLTKQTPIVAVFGNIDGQEIRSRFPEEQRLQRGGLDILMVHIGGYPGNYDKRIRHRINQNPPDIFISGHSHILKVIPDKKLHLLHINPGAAGKQGFQQVRTAVRFTIDEARVTGLEVFELGP